jgi:aryl-alcohol dehydrogenase
LIAVDTKPERLAVATALGATKVINATELDAVAELQKSGGVDFAVAATGVPAVMENAIAALAFNGEAVLVGVAPGQKVAIDPVFIQSRGLTIKGSIMAGRNGIPDLFIRELIVHWREGRLPVEKLIRFYDFVDINTAIHDAHQGSTIKPVLWLEHGKE